MKLSRFASILVLLVLVAPSWADELKTITGKSTTGTLEKITDNDITLNIAGKSIATPLPQVLDLTLRPGRTVPTAPKYIEVTLLDDSLLYCTKVTFGAKEAQLELTTGATVKIPIAAFVSILRDAHDENFKAQWQKLQAEKTRKDRIIVLKDGALSPLVGLFGDIDEKEQKIKFTLDVGGKEIYPQLEKIQGMQFVRTQLPMDANLCRVVDTDGNILVASKLNYAGAQINVQTPFGQKVAIEAKQIARFDFNFGRLTYLSDLDAKVLESALLGGFNPVRKDTNLDGKDPIMLQDKKYDKGLSMYAGVELEYNLAEKYKDFKALVGVDTRIAEEGQSTVTVTIYCDNEKRATLEVSTKAPIPVNISVKDVKTLRIIVSGSNFTNFAGHAMLANAHVSQ